MGHLPASRFRCSIRRRPRRCRGLVLPGDRSRRDRSMALDGQLVFDTVEGVKEGKEAENIPVNHVAPKTDVKRNTIAAAAAPNEYARPSSPAARASMASREKPPARNMAIPCTAAPHHSVTRRPRRSRVKTQIKVANYLVSLVAFLGRDRKRTM